MDGERMTTAGFYKFDGKMLLHSPTTVEAAFYFLSADAHETYNYPVDGWYWFDDEAAARVFFALPPPAPEPSSDSSPV